MCELILSLQDLQSDVAKHRNMVDSLNSTGDVIVRGSGSEMATPGESLEKQLKEMNERWTRIIDRSTEIRCLEINILCEFV